MATFTNEPSYSSSVSVKPEVLLAKFGDGYEQAVGNGINNKPRVFSLQFNTLSKIVGDNIEDFFDINNTATTSFDWTPPSGIAGKFKCESHSRTYVSGFASNISATFREVFF